MTSASSYGYVSVQSAKLIKSRLTKVRCGMKAKMMADETSHARVMTGKSKTASAHQLFLRYAFGKEMPVKRT